MSRVLMLELNELTPRLVDRFMAEGRLPNFKRLYDTSAVYTTEANESGLNLNPWIQWVTVHTGMPYSEHEVYLLGEGHKASLDTLANVVSDAGRKVEICGSMNVPFKAPINGYALPDAWADGVAAYPDKLEPFRKFVQKNVQEHTNPEFRTTMKDNVEFAKFLLGHGLSMGTVAAIVKQLVGERVSGGRWKRSFILDRLQWDVFSGIYKKLRPDFATFFSNSVAHAQHTHWREFEPEQFKMKAPDSTESFSDVIPRAYRENDRIIERALSLIDDDTTLIFCTALSQKPAVGWDDEGGKTFYRPYDLEKFSEFLGVERPFTAKPVMSEEFWLDVEPGEPTEEAIRRLEAATCNGEQLMKIWRRGDGVYTGSRIHHALPEDAVITTHDGRTAPLGEYLYRSEDIKSGMHDTKGLLWISTPDRRHSTPSQDTVALESIAPTVLALLGIEAPATMKHAPLAEIVDTARIAA